MGLKLFVDFEGGLTPGNIAKDIFLRFGGIRSGELFRECEEGKFSAAECLHQQAENLGILNGDSLDQFFKAQSVDRSFKDLLLFCKDHGIEFIVVSSGIDYPVRKILETNEIGDARFFANPAEFVPSGVGHRLKLRFPYADAECARCSCCKRNIMLTCSGEDDIVAYVGGEYSESCPAFYADLVFAKDRFQTICQRENITYVPYNTLLDVIDRLRSLLADGRGLRKRRRAELRRREAFLCE